MKNKYMLNIYPKTQSDLDDILRYISEELCNPSAAINLIDQIEHSLDLVCQNPEMYPLVNSSLIKDKTLRKLIVKNYIIFYRPVHSNKEIQIVRALYGMIDYEKFL